MIIRPDALEVSPVSVMIVMVYGYIPLPTLFPPSVFPSHIIGGREYPVDGTCVFRILMVLPVRLKMLIVMLSSDSGLLCSAVILVSFRKGLG